MKTGSREVGTAEGRAGGSWHTPNLAQDVWGPSASRVGITGEGNRPGRTSGDQKVLELERVEKTKPMGILRSVFRVEGPAEQGPGLREIEQPVSSPPDFLSGHQESRPAVRTLSRTVRREPRGQRPSTKPGPGPRGEGAGPCRHRSRRARRMRAQPS